MYTCTCIHAYEHAVKQRYKIETLHDAPKGFSSKEIGRILVRAQ